MVLFALVDLVGVICKKFSVLQFMIEGVELLNGNLHDFHFVQTHLNYHFPQVLVVGTSLFNLRQQLIASIVVDLVVFLHFYPVDVLADVVQGLPLQVVFENSLDFQAFRKVPVSLFQNNFDIGLVRTWVIEIKLFKPVLDFQELELTP